MSDLFISYSRVDREFVAKLAAALREQKRDVWVDLDDILYTEKWLDKIYRGIDEANHFAVILSPESVVSEVCQQELARAVDSHKRLLPILFKPLLPRSAPPTLAELNWIPFDPQAGFEDCVAKLQRAMDTDPGWVNLHTVLQVRARVWEQAKRDRGSELRGLELQEAIQWLADSAKQKDPRPTELQVQFIQFSQQSEAEEVARLKQLYASALARQLAAQAELVKEQDAPQIELSVLLAVQSLKVFPTAEATEILRRSLALLPPCHRCLDAGNRVTSIRASPRGDQLAAATENLIRVWAFPEGAFKRDIPHPAPINTLAFHPTGKFLATGIGGYSVDRSLSGVYILDLEAWRVVMALPHPDRVIALAWYPNGSYLLTSCADGIVRVWELAGVREVYQVRHNGDALSLDVSPDGKLVACAGRFDSAVLLYPADFKQPPKRLPHDSADYVTATAFSSDAKLLAAVDGFSVGQTTTFPIRVWDVGHGSVQQILYLRNATFAVRSMHFGPGDRDLLVTGGDATARLLSLDGKELARLPHTEIVQAVAWSRDGKWMITGADDHMVKIWPAWEGHEVAGVTVRNCCDPRNAFAFELNPKGRLAVLAVWDIKLIDVNTGAIWREGNFGSLALGVAFSRDGSMLAVAGKTEKVKLLDAESLQVLRSYDHPTFVSAAAFDPTGSMLATACWDGVVRIFSIKDSALLRLFPIGGIVTSVEFSADRKYLVACSQDKRLLVWDFTSEKEVFRQVLNDLPWSTSFDPHSRMLACAGDGIRLWDIEKRAELLNRKVPAHSVRFSPSGKTMAAAFSDGVRLWNTQTFRETAFIPNTAGARNVAFTPDERYLITAGKTNTDCVVRTWFVEVEDLLETACKRAPRSLTEQERRIYLPET